MRGSRQETVEELKKQIYDLQKKLGELHAGDVNSLKRFNATISQHIATLGGELQDVNKAATRLDRTAKTFSGQECAKEVAQSLGFLWLGGVITFWLKSSFKLGRSVSGVMFLFAAVSAVVPLGVRSCRRLRRVILENPQAVDELLAALAVMEERVNIMCELAITNAPSSTAQALAETAAGGPDAARPMLDMGPASAITDGSTIVPAAGGEEVARMSSPLASGSDDLVHLMPSDWESPTAARHGITIDGTDLQDSEAIITTDQGQSSVENMAVSEAGQEGSLHASVVSVSEDNRDQLTTADS
eukprot:jgi/Ulvmu1/5581/UM023_0118.1